MNEPICANCIFIGQRTEDKNKRLFNSRHNFICECEANAKFNYITGQFEYSDCLTSNEYGQCLHFQDINKTDNDPEEDITGTEIPSSDSENSPTEEEETSKTLED